HRGQQRMLRRLRGKIIRREIPDNPSAKTIALREIDLVGHRLLVIVRQERVRSADIGSMRRGVPSVGSLRKGRNQYVIVGLRQGRRRAPGLPGSGYASACPLI